MSYNCYDDKDDVDRYKNYGWKSGSAKTPSTSANSQVITASKYDPQAYQNPWETAKEGCWVIKKNDGITSTRRLTEQEMMDGMEELHYAMAYGCDIMMNKMLDLQNSGRPLSISEIVLETINEIGKEIKRRKNESNVGNPNS